MRTFRLLLIVCLVLVVSLGALFPRESFAATGFFGGSFVTLFRTVQNRVQEIHAKVTRFFGSREEGQSIVPPFFSIMSPLQGDEWVIGSTAELRWEYANLSQGATKIYLLPRIGSEVLLAVLPARRGARSSDDYDVPIRFLPGMYRFRICNGNACEESGEVSLVFASLLELLPYSLGSSTAPVLLLQWVRYSSPLSLRVALFASEALAKYPGDVRTAVRYLPSHSLSSPLALSRSALCASEQGAEYFWELHPRLSSGEWDASAVRSFLSSLPAFQLAPLDACLESRGKQNILDSFSFQADQEDITEPSLVLVGPGGERKVFSGEFSYEDVEKAISQFNSGSLLQPSL
ncbi:MAG: hypothetical protein Q8P01_05535 [bacterium]|nr:hypothetical protein [bacterium]